MNKWMESGRAAPKQESVSGSAPSSPARNGRKRMICEFHGAHWIGLHAMISNADSSGDTCSCLRKQYISRIETANLGCAEWLSAKISCDRKDIDGRGFSLCRGSDGAVDARV